MDFVTDVESCIPSLRRYARALVHHPDDADDLVQDCLERAIGRRHLWCGGASVRPWLFRIMRNLYTNQVRSRRAHTAAEPVEALREEPAEDGAQSARVTLGEMEAALATLSEEQRQVVLMVALSGMSYRDCATALGVPIGTVMSRLARGRESLRRALDGGVTAKVEPRLRRVK
jgi:RNA polymerase sigma-70 factor (ECF subfamily)